MQNQTVKVIGRRPVYPVEQSNDCEQNTRHYKDDAKTGEIGAVFRFRSNHTITVLGRLSSCLSDK